jgi:hypothetical protein
MDIIASLFILVAFVAGAWLGRFSSGPCFEIADFGQDRRDNEEVLRYWHKARPIPPGWELASDLADCHHGEYAIIIRKVKQ